MFKSSCKRRNIQNMPWEVLKQYVKRQAIGVLLLELTGISRAVRGIRERRTTIALHRDVCETDYASRHVEHPAMTCNADTLVNASSAR